MKFDLPVMYHDHSPGERRLIREQYIREQDGRCMHCGGPLSAQPPERIQRKRINWRLFPENFLKHPVHLQHCHKSGMTEGAVHARCNAVLWQYHGR